MVLEHGIEKCRVCDNYLRGAETCKFCHFEWATEYPPTDESTFDILDLDDNLEWSHFQIMDRLKYKCIDCLNADIFYGDTIAYVIGANADAGAVARALGMHKECVYDCGELPLLILNLFQEKYLRGELDE